MVSRCVHSIEHQGNGEIIACIRPPVLSMWIKLMVFLGSQLQSPQAGWGRPMQFGLPTNEMDTL